MKYSSSVSHELVCTCPGVSGVRRCLSWQDLQDT